MSDTRIWQSLRLTVAPGAVEAVEFALNSLEALGTQIDFTGKPSDDVCVIGYFERLPEDQKIQDELRFALKSYKLVEDAIFSTEKREIEDADWLAEWKKHWKPTIVGRFVIAPPWIALDDPEKIVIRIEPNMAFGTGTHETTQLCLQAMDEFYNPGASLLDVGTGTGLLAIAAAKLTAGNTSFGECVLYGCDIDPEAIKIARENATLNGVGEQIEFFEGSVPISSPQFDFICANLTLDVIQPALPVLLAKTRKFLVLSGILAEQENAIRRSLSENDVSDPVVRHSGEWISVIVKKGI
jgi:ribosomal protein L11 methyltransferase